MLVLAVAFGGALGSVSRYLIAQTLPSEFFPAATFSINATGSFGIGVLSAYLLSTGGDSTMMRLFIQIGFLGGFTTFSTFSLEVVQLIQAQKILLASGYAAISMVICIGFVFLGMDIGKRIFL